MMQFLHDNRFIQFYTEYTERSHWTSAVYGLDFLCVRTGPVPRPIAHPPRQVVLYWYAIREPEDHHYNSFRIISNKNMHFQMLQPL